MRRQIPLLITGFLGAIYIVTFFIPATRFVEVVTTDWILIIQAFAIWLGALNLLKLSVIKLTSRKPGGGYAGIVILSFLATVAAGMAPMLRGDHFLGDHNYMVAGSLFEWIYNSVFVPLNATMFSLLAFFVASASYRAFRARNREATLLLGAACVLMLGRVPLGDAITGFLPEGWTLSAWADVFMNYPVLAGQRAIMIGIALGIISTSLRLVLGIERSHVGGE